MPGIASFLGFSKPPVAKQPTEQEEPDAKTQFQTMIDREELEVNIEMELDSDVESVSIRPLPICAICKKSEKHDHEECAKKYNPMDRGYYDEEGGFVEYTPPHYFVKEAQRLSQDPGPEGQHYRALQAYKKSVSQVELYLAAKQETYGESAKGNGSRHQMDVFSLRAYQQHCRIYGPDNHYCPCGCGNPVFPGTSILIPQNSNGDYSSSDSDVDGGDNDIIHETTDESPSDNDAEADTRSQSGDQSNTITVYIDSNGNSKQVEELESGSKKSKLQNDLQEDSEARIYESYSADAQDDHSHESHQKADDAAIFNDELSAKQE